MILQEIQRLQFLAGIISEAITDMDRENAFAKSGERTSFNIEKMKEYIANGMIIGLLFKANNDKYTTPVYKYRTIMPCVLGLTKKNKLAIRGYHLVGQSEKEALATGKRSAEVQNVWRLFKTENIRGVWFTGRYFNENPPNYHPNDKQLHSILAKFEPGQAKKFQDSLRPDQNPEESDV